MRLSPAVYMPAARKVRGMPRSLVSSTSTQGGSREASRAEAPSRKTKNSVPVDFHRIAHEVHLEHAGPTGSMVFFSMQSTDGRLFEILDQDEHVLSVVTIESLVSVSNTLNFHDHSCEPAASKLQCGT